MSALTGRDRLAIALRALWLQSTWNYERQQGVGFAWALKPALDRLVADPRERARRLADHTAYFNTQPTLASIAIGAVAAAEEESARSGGAGDAAIPRLKQLLGASLAALGDRLFWFTLRPVAALAGVLASAASPLAGAVVLWTCYNLLHLGVRFAGVGWGYRGGPAAVSDRLRGRLERGTRLLGAAGACLVGVVMAWLLAPGGQPQPVAAQATLAAGLGIGFFTAQRPRPSPTEWALGLGLACVAVSWFRS